MSDPLDVETPAPEPLNIAFRDSLLKLELTANAKVAGVQSSTGAHPGSARDRDSSKPAGPRGPALDRLRERWLQE
jgi:hypothetical protein